MSINRRRFLQTSAAGGAALGVGIALPGCGNDVSPAPAANVPVDDDLTSSTYGQIKVAVAMFPQLAVAGGAITLRLQGLAKINDNIRTFAVPPDNSILLVQFLAGKFAALQSSCPHAGCPLGFSAKDQLVECPCHSSRFRVDADITDPKSCIGQVTHAPAQQGLQAWTVTLDTTRNELTIDLTQPLSCNDAFPAIVGGTLTLPLTDFPQLSMVGGTATGQPAGFKDPIIVVRTDASTLVALDARCTHLGCTVAFSAKGMDLECPCHGSKFALTGAVTSGPASDPLAAYTVNVTADAVVITIN
jgi:cytochrome b6-f complex iron-sulfur subunit